MAKEIKVEVKSKKKEAIWKIYKLGFQVDGLFGGQLPRSETEIRAMLEHRMPTKKPEDAIPVEELVDKVVSQVDVQDEDDDDYIPSWSTFKHNVTNTLVYEGRSVRGHLKDCALQVQNFHKDVKNFRSKVVNRLYVMDDLIPLYREDGEPYKEVVDTEVRYIQVMTRQGPRSAIKHIDYVMNPYFEVTIKLLNDGIINMSHIESILEYGAVHGMGAERSQGWGRYEIKQFVEV